MRRDTLKHLSSSYSVLSAIQSSVRARRTCYNAIDLRVASTRFHSSIPYRAQARPCNCNQCSWLFRAWDAALTRTRAVLPPAYATSNMTMTMTYRHCIHPISSSRIHHIPNPSHIIPRFYHGFTSTSTTSCFQNSGQLYDACGHMGNRSRAERREATDSQHSDVMGERPTAALFNNRCARRAGLR